MNKTEEELEQRAHDLIIHAYFKNPGATVRVRGFLDTRQDDIDMLERISRILKILGADQDFILDYGNLTMRLDA